jgi:hypothetical protein
LAAEITKADPLIDGDPDNTVPKPKTPIPEPEPEGDDLSNTMGLNNAQRKKLLELKGGNNKYKSLYDYNMMKKCFDALRTESFRNMREKATKFRVGTEVDARLRGGEEYFPGQILKDNGDGTYKIKYESGDLETNVPERYIKRRKFPIGAEVEARFNGDDDWLPGEITKANGDDTYMVDYHNGEREERVHKSLIREKGSGDTDGQSSRKSKSISYKSGQFNPDREFVRRRTMLDEDPEAAWETNPLYA